MADDLDEARRRRQRRQATQPVGAFGPSGAKQARINQVLAKVDAAAEAHDPSAYYAGKTPTPERITMALDLRELYGPEVDRALGGEEPMVDEWESGVRVPALTQIQALAKLTEFPVRFFYQPPPLPLSGGWLCGSDGCTPLLPATSTCGNRPPACHVGTTPHVPPSLAAWKRWKPAQASATPATGKPAKPTSRPSPPMIRSTASSPAPMRPSSAPSSAIRHGAAGVPRPSA